MSALDAALEVIEPVLNTADEGQGLVAAKCYGLLSGYDARWHDAPYRIDGVEAILTSDLVNPESNRKSRSFIIAGKIDVRATEIETGAKVIFDHKTASADISDPNATYWQQLKVEGQPSHYMLLEWMNGNRVDKAIWDVVRKPGIAPRIVTKKEIDVLKPSQSDIAIYHGHPLTEQDRGYLDATGRESLPMYAARLAWDCTTTRPEWYFQRRSVARLDTEIHEYAMELWDHGQDLLATRQSERNPRNSGYCMNYSAPCKYLGICSGSDSFDSGKWTQKAFVHNEIPILGESGTGKEILTNSRIRMFQSCRRKHLYDYEIGWEKLDEEERETLFFGNLYHSALEAYFLELQRQQAAPVSVAQTP